MILLISIGISLILVTSVEAKFNDEYNNDNWTAKYKLEIYKHHLNKTYNANGEDKAKMNIVMKNKTNDVLERAQSDIEILLRSDRGILKSQKITILEGKAMSEDFSLTATQSGIIIVIAEAIGFEVAKTRVEFVPSPNPSELKLTAQPNENIMANGKKSTKLTVKLLNPDESLFIPQADKQIDIWTNKGEKLQLINISKDKPYAQTEFKSYKPGTVDIIASSPDFNLKDHSNVTFVSPITLFTIFIAFLGGFLGGAVKYYQDHKNGFSFLPKRQKNGTWKLRMFGNAFFHAFCGVIVFVAAFFEMPQTNIFYLPIDIWYGVFMIGFTGGLYFFTISSLWNSLYNKIGVKHH